MKTSCNIIRDLLPLYAENMTSSDSNALVQEHLTDCEDCRKMLELFQTTEPEIGSDTGALGQIQRQIRRRRLLTAWTAVLLTASVLCCLLAWVITPVAVSLEELEIYVTETEYGLCVHLEGDYDLLTVTDETDTDTGAVSYTLIAARRRYHSDGRRQEYRISNNDVAQIWYEASRDGEEDTLLWGHSNGGRISLPRIALGGYFMMALAGGLVLAILAWLLRKKKGCGYLSAGAVLCSCFALADWIVTGGDWRMYYSTDLPVVFGMLILIAGLATGGFCCGWKLWNFHKKDSI